MKLGIIIKPNEKGQLVIPKELREKLGIEPDSLLHVVLRGDGIYIYPVHGIISDTQNENSYVKVLERTKGAWATATNHLATSGKKRQLELETSAKRKKAW